MKIANDKQIKGIENLFDIKFIERISEGWSVFRYHFENKVQDYEYQSVLWIAGKENQDAWERGNAKLSYYGYRKDADEWVDRKFTLDEIAALAKILEEE